MRFLCYSSRPLSRPSALKGSKPILHFYWLKKMAPNSNYLVNSSTFQPFSTNENVLAVPKIFFGETLHFFQGNFCSFCHLVCQQPVPYN